MIFSKIFRIMKFLASPEFKASYYLSTSGYLIDKGWFKSSKQNKCIDKNEKVLPWLTYPFVDFISSRLNSDMKVFEYGSGYSTIWWASRVKEVVSIEHNKGWYDNMVKQVPSNVNIEYVGLEYGGEYCKKALRYTSSFDIMVIDGRDRVNCTKNCISALKPNGIVVFDNAEREQYNEAFNFLFKNGFSRIDFYGIGPINIDGYCTSIFYRDSNCIMI